MSGIWKDEARFKKIAETVRNLAGASTADADKISALAECVKRVDISARINELEAVLTDLEDADAPDAAAPFLRRVRRNLENKIAGMAAARGDDKGDAN